MHFSKRLARFLWLVLASAALLTVAAYGGTLLVVRHKEQAVDRAWAETYGSLDGFDASLPRTEKNETARRLEELCWPLGFPLRSLALNEAQPTGPWNEVEGDVHGYLEVQLETPSPAVAPPPAPVARFLSQRAGERETLLDLLATAVPLWDQDMERPPIALPPHRLGLMGLAEWLVADALAQLAEGRSCEALRDLAGARRLTESLRLRPELLSQDAALATARMCAGVLRKLDRCPEGWEPDLLPGAFEPELQRAARYVAWSYREAGRRSAAEPYTGRMARREGLLWKTFGRLWFRLSMADAGERFLAEVAEAQRLGFCSADYPATLDRIARSTPWWSSIGRFGIVSLGRSWASMRQLQLDLELTRKLFEVRAARDPVSGAWPRTVEGIEKTRCEGARWDYAVEEDGSAFLRYAGSVARPDRPGRIDLPVEFWLPAPVRAPRLRLADSR